MWYFEDGPPHKQGRKFVKMTDNQVVDFVLNLDETCEIDVINKFRSTHDNRALTLHVIGSLLGVTRERIRQIEARALRRLRIRTAWDRHRAYRDHIRDEYGVPTDPYVEYLPNMMGVGSEIKGKQANNRWAEYYGECQKPKVRK